jgi:hypothetical protein
MNHAQVRNPFFFSEGNMIVSLQILIPSFWKMIIGSTEPVNFAISLLKLSMWTAENPSWPQSKTRLASLLHPV